VTPLIVGIGLSSAATAGELADAVDAALLVLGATRSDVLSVATRVELSADQRILALGLPIHGFGASQLSAVAVPNPRPRVAEAVSTASVAEAAALAAAGESGVLVLPKQRSSHVTVAVARSG
jgi:cobalamin biosynthesis protein CbiG